jgi:formiminotetrahydrofolate cyclodeaminase
MPLQVGIDSYAPIKTGNKVTVLSVLGLHKSLDALADSDADAYDKALEASRRPKRAGKPRKVGSDYDF